jgi:hypothetical protein
MTTNLRRVARWRKENDAIRHTSHNAVEIGMTAVTDAETEEALILVRRATSTVDRGIRGPVGIDIGSQSAGTLRKIVMEPGLGGKKLHDRANLDVKGP